ncbi:MAG: hypothetical protein M1351_07610 [Candidatus Thermoplasmatota archaeon]|nr:hypothetical protein [Candidatus Thermoplasmatota archaeon]
MSEVKKMGKCDLCKKNFDTPLKLYVHLVEKHGFSENDARLAAWPKGAQL